MGLCAKRTTRRGRNQPLIDLGLFRARGFSAGLILSTLLTFALIGLLFAVPQYFQAVLGYDAMATGLRLLPLIGGIIAGLGLGDQISAKAGARIATAAGFSVAAIGLLAAAFTSADRGTAFVAAWLAACGVGTGVALPPTIDAALGSLNAEDSGVGSALIAAVRQVGGAFGVAVLGSVLNSAYRGGLRLGDLPAPTRKAIGDNVTTGIAMARHLGSNDLVAMIRNAFTHGMDVSLAWSAGIAASAAVLAAVLLPVHTGRSD